MKHNEQQRLVLLGAVTWEDFDALQVAGGGCLGILLQRIVRMRKMSKFSYHPCRYELLCLVIVAAHWKVWPPCVAGDDVLVAAAKLGKVLQDPLRISPHISLKKARVRRR